MAKINIAFNDKDYSIDEASLSTAITTLRNHLSSAISGNGPVINFGAMTSFGTIPYSIDSEILSATTNALVSHLGTIAGSGHKVVVGGVEYNIDSDKVSGAISELETVLDNLNAPVSKNIVLEVKKITSTSYANNKTYTNQNFILLNIYPKTNGTVSVTYGGLTKTVTDTSGAEEPAAQQVVFGTLNDVYHDGMTITPSSGTLTIEGDCSGFGVGTFNKSKSTTEYCSCITAVNDFGDVTDICANAFRGCTGITSVIIPDSVTSIGAGAFENCTGLTSVSFDNTDGWYVENTTFGSTTPVDVTDPVANVTLLTNTYKNGCIWKRA